MPCMISFRGVLLGDLSPELCYVQFCNLCKVHIINYICVGTYVTLYEYIEGTYILYNKIYTFCSYNFSLRIPINVIDNRNNSNLVMIWKIR